MASTVVGSTFEAVKALPYKNAIKFANENIHFNYKTMMVRRCGRGFGFPCSLFVEQCPHVGKWLLRDGNEAW